MNIHTPKAVALVSGGLDSLLAARLMLDQGVQVEGINFYTGFCHSGHTSAIRKTDKAKPKRNDALWVAEQLGIKLHIIDIVEEYKNILTKPKHGYGKNLNPCLDCKIFMVQKAQEWMNANDFDFIITGEVIGQRPKSQLKRKMQQVVEESGIEDRLLRPLSGQLLPETLPERMGWVNREQLLAIHGRSRSEQIALAEKFGFEEYSQPAGGCCVLTDECYTKKLRDMWQNRGSKEYSLDDIILLKVGRHLRPKPHFKLIVAREEGENNFLSGFRRQFAHIEILSHAGPLVLLDGDVEDQEDIMLAAKISARFCAGRDSEQVTLKVTDKNQHTEKLTIKPMLASEIPQEWYV